MGVRVIGVCTVLYQQFNNSVVAPSIEDCGPQRLVTVFICNIDLGTTVDKQGRTIQRPVQATEMKWRPSLCVLNVWIFTHVQCRDAARNRSSFNGCEK